MVMPFPPRGLAGLPARGGSPAWPARTWRWTFSRRGSGSRPTLTASSRLGCTAFCSPCSGLHPARAPWRAVGVAGDLVVEAFFDVLLVSLLLVQGNDGPCF